MYKASACIPVRGTVTRLQIKSVVQVYEEVQQWEPPSPGLQGMVPVGSMTIPAQVTSPIHLP